MRKYVIINSDEVQNIDFNQVLEKSENTIRYSQDKTKTFIKLEDTEVPIFLECKQQFNSEEILSILSGPEWTESSGE